MGNRLYGKEKDLIMNICRLNDEEALEFLANRYGGNVINNNNSLGVSVKTNGYYRTEIESLIDKGYFKLRELVPIATGSMIVLTSDCWNYPDIEKDSMAAQHKGGMDIFRKIYDDKERDLIMNLPKSEVEALQFLAMRYKGEVAPCGDCSRVIFDVRVPGSDLEGEISSLINLGWYDDRHVVDGSYAIALNPNYRHYLKMETDYDATNKSPVNVNVKVNGDMVSSNVAVGNISTNNQTATTGVSTAEIVTLISEMKKDLAGVSFDDAKLKEDLEYYLDAIKKEVEAQGPDESIISRTMQRLQDAIKSITAKTDLPANYVTLQSYIVTKFPGIVDSLQGIVNKIIGG